MKKIFFILGLSPFVCAMLPLTAFAAIFEHDLSIGMLHNADIKSLQEFLHHREFYDGPITGNFLSLTKQALIRFQEKEGIVPAQGYFGPKTRAHINTLTEVATPSREEQIILLRSQLEAMQARLTNLIAQQQAALVTSTPAVSPSPSSSPSPIPTPSATTTPTTPVAELRINGNLTQSFPNSAGSPIKLGDITISNTTNHAILFNQFKLDIYDGMNSAANRGKTVLFKLRNGTTTFDTLMSETKFDINNNPPPMGGETRRQLDVSFPVVVQPGQTYVSSLWLENLDYVISGSFRIQMLAALISDGVIPQGGFTFILTGSL